MVFRGKKKGKKESDALKSLRSSLSSHYKNQYKHAKTQKEKDKIIEHCNRLRYKGKAIFTGSEYASWKKEKELKL